jgi:hypothetical protein
MTSPMSCCHLYRYRLWREKASSNRRIFENIAVQKFAMILNKVRALSRPHIEVKTLWPLKVGCTRRKNECMTSPRSLDSLLFNAKLRTVLTLSLWYYRSGLTRWTWDQPDHILIFESVIACVFIAVQYQTTSAEDSLTSSHLPSV